MLENTESFDIRTTSTNDRLYSLDSFSTKLPTVEPPDSTQNLLHRMELSIPFVRADAPKDIKELGTTLDALAKTKSQNGLRISQNEDGSYNLSGTSGVNFSIRPNGDVVSFGNKPGAKVKGTASVDENGSLVVKEKTRQVTITKDGTSTLEYKTEYGDLEDEVPVKKTEHSHGRFKTTQYDLPTGTVTEDEYRDVPKDAVKVAGTPMSVKFDVKEGSISIADGATTWTAAANGDLLKTKDGKTETLKPLVDAKFKPSGLRCGGGTYTFPDGTEVFFKNGMVFSLSVKGKGTTVEGNYHLSDYGKSPVVKVTRAK